MVKMISVFRLMRYLQGVLEKSSLIWMLLTNSILYQNTSPAPVLAAMNQNFRKCPRF